MLQLLRSDWPYPARRAPVFYGWIIAGLSTLGFLMSIPGQTMGLAVFADVFIEATGLSRTQLSTAYLLGTLASALLLTRAGRWYDRFGARIMIVSSSIVLAITLVYLAFIQQISTSLAQWTGLGVTLISFPLIVLGYYGVRFSGQGVLTSASRNVLLVWFNKRRGLVSGVRGVFVSLGFSIAPLLIALLMDSAGWQGALLWMAFAVGGVFALVALLAIRDHPQQCGLQADNTAVQDTRSNDSLPNRDYSLAQARRSVVFWLYAASLSIHALFGTAVTFHIVAIFSAAGRSRAEAFSYFIPQAVVSLTVNLAGSALADYTRLKPMLIVMLAAFITGAFGLLNLSSQWGYYLLVVGFGAGGGLWGVLSNLVFIRQFGALHLGEISGLNTSLTVMASAIGPVVFSLALDGFGTFDAAAWVCIAGLCLLLALAVALPQPLDRVPVRD